MDKAKVREYLLYAKIYRFCALFFVVIGISLFAFLFFNASGSFLEKFQSPLMLGIMVLPFLPAFVLSMLAHRAERIVMETLRESGVDVRERTDLFSSKGIYGEDDEPQ